MENNNTVTRANSFVNKPDSYLVWSILSTVLCCMPFGIAAIVYSTKVDSLWNSGDELGAQDASKKAKMWMLIAVGCGVLAYIIIVILSMLGALAGLAEIADELY